MLRTSLFQDLDLPHLSQFTAPPCPYAAVLLASCESRCCSGGTASHLYTHKAAKTHNCSVVGPTKKTHTVPNKTFHQTVCIRSSYPPPNSLRSIFVSRILLFANPPKKWKLPKQLPIGGCGGLPSFTPPPEAWKNHVFPENFDQICSNKICTQLEVHKSATRSLTTKASEKLPKPNR